MHQGDKLILETLKAEDRQGLRNLTQLSLISMFGWMTQSFLRPLMHHRKVSLALFY